MYDSVETSMSAHENPLSVIISTQAPTDQDLLSIIIDDAKAYKPKNVVLVMHEAPEKDVDDKEMDPFDLEKSIKPANPAYGLFLQETEIQNWVDKASRMPSAMNTYRNLILNQRVDPVSAFMTRPVWQGCKKQYDSDILYKGPLYGAMDLSSTLDLTCRVYVVACLDGWYLDAKFWLPSDGIRERGKQEKVPYERWVDEGWLTLCPGKVISYEWVAKSIKEEFDRYDIRKIAFDRWNWNQFKPWLEHADFPVWEINEKDQETSLWVPFGQGYASMGPAIRTFEEQVVSKKLYHNDNPILNMCMVNAKAVQDPSGFRNLAKSKSSGRIDGAVSSVMGIATAIKEFDPEEETGGWNDDDFSVADLA